MVWKGLFLSTLARSSDVIADPVNDLHATPDVVGQDERRDESGEAAVQDYLLA